MNEFVLYGVIVVLVALVVYMFVRMRRLYQVSLIEEGDFKYSLSARPETLSLAKNFVCEELLEVRPKSSFLTPELATLYNEAISYYLIGFIDDLAAYYSLDNDAKNQLTLVLLKESLDLSPIQLIRYCTNVSKAASNSRVAELVRIGGIACYAWVKKKQVPMSISMKAQVNNYVLSVRREEPLAS